MASAAPAKPAQSEAAQSDAAQDKRAQGTPAQGKSDGGDKELSGMSIVGNDDAPKSLVIVPWKSSELGDTLGLAASLDDVASARRQARVHARARLLRDQIEFEVTLNVPSRIVS